jgi:ribonuclease HI
MNIALINADASVTGRSGYMRIGYTVKNEHGLTLARVGYHMGQDGSVNLAEYLAIVNATRHALRMGAHDLRIVSDSQLAVQQIKGKYKVNNKRLKALHTEFNHITRFCLKWSIDWDRRENNTEADALSRKAVYEEHPDLVSNAFAPYVWEWQAPIIVKGMHSGAPIRVAKDIWADVPKVMEQIAVGSKFPLCSREGEPIWAELPDVPLIPVKVKVKRESSRRESTAEDNLRIIQLLRFDEEGGLPKHWND